MRLLLGVPVQGLHPDATCGGWVLLLPRRACLMAQAHMLHLCNLQAMQFISLIRQSNAAT
jgi:hypothetical protein